MAIIPGMTDLTRPYWDAARQGRLVVQRCGPCGRLWHPPLPRCPHCYAPGPGWQQVAGTGTVYTYTVVTHPTHIALTGKVPYVVAIVELTEGPRLVTGITGRDPRDVRAGMPVRVRFTEVANGVTLPFFCPASQGGFAAPSTPSASQGGFAAPSTPLRGEDPPDTPLPGGTRQRAPGPRASHLPGWGRPRPLSAPGLPTYRAEVK